MAKQNKKIFRAKRERRKELARLPVEDKFKIVLQLQQIASPTLKSRGVEKGPWMTSNAFVESINLDEFKSTLPTLRFGSDWTQVFSDPRMVNIDSGYVRRPFVLSFKTCAVDSLVYGS